MEYKIIVRKVGIRLARRIDQAAEELAKEVNEHLAKGWEPAGGVAMGLVGAAPFLVQAVVRRR